MDEYIRQLTHDNERLTKEWPDIFKKLQQLSMDIPEINQTSFKVKSLDALVDYVLADSEEFVQIKSTFLNITMEKLTANPLPSLNELVRIFSRVLEMPNTNNLLNLTFLRGFYNSFRLGEHLSTNLSVDLIESILISLQKHEFSDQNFHNKEMKEKWSSFLSRSIFSPISSDRNKLNSEPIMTQMRSHFQQLYRWAARHSQQSHVWSEVQYTLTNSFPTLFDSFTNPDDAPLHLTACVEPPISFAYVKLIAKFYQHHVDSFKTNESQIYTVMEKFLSQNHLKEADCLMDYTIIPHFNSIVNLEELLQILIGTCSSSPTDSRNEFCKVIISPISYALTRKKFPKKFAGIFFDLILAILDLNIIEAPVCACRILNISEFYPWKQLDKQLTHLIQSCITYDQIMCESSANQPQELEKILKLIHERAKTNVTIYHATHEIALQAILKWSTIINKDTGKSYDKYVFKMGEEMTELVDQEKVSIDICMQLIEILQKRIENNDESNDPNQADNQFLIRVANLLSRSIEQLKILPMALHQKIATYCLTAFDCPLTMENGSMTLAHRTSLSLWFKLIHCLNNEDDARAYAACADRLYQLVYDEGEEKFHAWWETFWCVVAIKYPNVAAEHITQFLQEVIDRKRFTLVSILPVLYAKQPEEFHARLDDLLHALFENNGQYLPSILSVFSPIATAHPELITTTQIDYIFTSIQTHPNTLQQMNSVFPILGHIASVQPQLFDSHREELIRLITTQQNLPVFFCFQQYLVASTILHGEQAADESLTLLMQFLKTIPNISPDLSTQILHTCQLIGIRYKQILASKRQELIPFESNSVCRMLIDMIDGNKMTEENQVMMNRTIDEIAQIEQRVVHTERDVKDITKLVRRQELNTLVSQYSNSHRNPSNAAIIAYLDGLESRLNAISFEIQTITNLDSRVDIVDNHLNNLTEQVQIHAQEIERIDAKTLSYVPSEWGRDVCTLLNIRAKNDWRLLGKRFGYSSSELKHWAMQIDPSMSLLNEWFMTHKADEATYGLVKMLKEIGREDVEQIIRKAVIAAGELIPDDLPMEIKRLPPIFLSYQWGSQQEVLKLKTNLEQAGYACWMDIGQMGGGDKLFAQIDAGIRGAKVIICCMNTAYAQSDNCSREVHLTISTGKPLIPLQMEKQTWPPEGALGPIMSEYLYIRFYDRKTNNQNSWPAEKFTELLGQIRYHVAPDPDMITEQYHNWFVPRVDHLIFLQPTTSNIEKEKQPIPDDTPLVVTHPQIMISYQWDYQTVIVKLYEKLTKLGYRCWLDIFQMGGGDSLFEKIDTGIRHSKCVLSCVTPKYTKSINCRREMALADALQKPIVPLLLEETSTWPPAGPMAMVFAEKPYIDFRRADDKCERWTGKEFELVLVRLKQTVPEVQTEKPQRYLLDMQRPTTALKHEEKKSKRIGSAPVIAQSRACSIM